MGESKGESLDAEVYQAGIGHQARQLATDPAVADRVARGVNYYGCGFERGGR